MQSLRKQLFLFYSLVAVAILATSQIAAAGTYYTSITAGFDQSCVIQNFSGFSSVPESPRILCWGSNASGQLGYTWTGIVKKGSTPPTTISEPVAVEGLVGTPAQVSAGNGYTCALVNNPNQVMCWGWNYYNQLGHGNWQLAQSVTPVVAFTNTSDPVTQISSGQNHACALTSAGKVWCWGDNTFLESGGPVNMESESNPQLINLPGPAIAVSSGLSFSCAIVASLPTIYPNLPINPVYCWGLVPPGLNPPASIQTPWDGIADHGWTPYQITWLGISAQQISAGSDFVCVIGPQSTTSALFEECWGGNESGQIGTGVNYVNDWTTPVYVPTLGSGLSLRVPTATMAQGSSRIDNYTVYSNLAFPSSSNFILEGWGTSPIGGSFGGFYSTTPVNVNGFGLLANNTITAPSEIAAGFGHTCAIAYSSGTAASPVGDHVYCWGWDVYGQVGNGITTSSVPLPVQVL